MRLSPLPRITVVMPSFNQAAFIEEAIQSVLAQKYSNLEFMILDGGSTDGSVAIIERYADRLTYWHSQPDKGQTDALIQGFDRATGDLLGWVNSDDVLLPGCLQRISQVYSAHPKGGLFGGNYLLIDQNSRIIRCKRHPSQAAWFAQRGLFIVNQPGSFFKKVDYQTVGGLNIDLHYVMDTDLYIRMLINGTRYVYVNSWLSGFRKQSMAKTIAQAAKAKEESKLAKRQYLPMMRTIIGWRYLYVVWQVVNGNYLRMSIETMLACGKNWSEWSGQQLGKEFAGD